MSKGPLVRGIARVENPGSDLTPLRERRSPPLEALLAPTSTKELLDLLRGRCPALLEARRGRFADLLTWDDVNRLVESDTAEFRRFRLAKDESTLPWQDFTMFDDHLGRPRILPVVVQAMLYDGYTLVVDGIDQLLPKLRAVTAEFERILGARAYVNAYICTRESWAFGLHWDNHEVFAMQVTGAKRWRVQPPTVANPVRDPRFEVPAPRGGDDQQSFDMEDGSVLFVPRGWWHEVTTLTAPSIHLSVSVPLPRANALITSMLAMCECDELFREDVPVHGGLEAQQVYRRALAEAVLSWIDAVDFERVLDRASVERDPGRSSLPTTGVAHPSPQREWSVAFRAATDPELTGRPDGTVLMRLDDTLWTLDSGAGSLVDQLVTREELTVGDLVDCHGDLDADEIGDFIVRLARFGFLRVDPEGPLAVH